MASTAFRQYASENGGRVILLFLLFLLAIYQLYTAGFNAFAIVCALPILVLVALSTFHYRMFCFWALMGVNYIVQWHGISFPQGIPTSLYNEMLELILIAMAIIDLKESHFERLANIMLYALLVWCGFCTLEVLNDTCGIGINIGSWYTSARMLAFQLMYAFIVYTLYITNPKLLVRYLFVWGVLSLFAVFWVWKQKNIGLMPGENAWLQTRGRTTHILAGGTLIRYFSVYSDAANFGIGIASTAVAFIIFGITSKIKKHRYFFLITGVPAFGACFHQVRERLLPV